MDIDLVAATDGGMLSQKLKDAGYDRGKITDIIAPRLRTLMQRIKAGNLDDLSAHVQAGVKDGASRLLRGIDGAGPGVAATAWMLLQSNPE